MKRIRSDRLSTTLFLVLIVGGLLCGVSQVSAQSSPATNEALRWQFLSEDERFFFALGVRYGAASTARRVGQLARWTSEWAENRDESTVALSTLESMSDDVFTYATMGIERDGVAMDLILAEIDQFYSNPNHQDYPLLQAAIHVFSKLSLERSENTNE